MDIEREIMLVPLWQFLLVGAAALLFAQAVMIRRIRHSRSTGLSELQGDLPPRTVLRLLDLRLNPRLRREASRRRAGASPLRIVVATPDRSFRRVAQFLLGREGFGIDVARDFDAALDVAARRAADVVVFDGSDSLLDAARAMRRLAEQQPGVAAVVVSDGEDEPPQTLPVLPKWGGFDAIVAAIEAAHAGAARA